MIRIEELRALLDAATPGPWRTRNLADVGSDSKPQWLTQVHHGTEADAALIAAAPEALALLLAFADEVKAACAPARGIPPDVWGATKDDVIVDVHAALARLEGTP